MIFSVPLTDAATTIERARLSHGIVEHVLPAAYHTDPLRAGSWILVFRDYGADIIERVGRAGFSDVRLLPPPPQIPWNLGRRIIVAMR